jgi:uncharacterized RDD family membrane protein YckC
MYIAQPRGMKRAPTLLPTSEVAVSILPLPELPSQSNDVLPAQPGLHLSALDAYAGQPGALPGVTFWPRVAARVIDTVVHYIIAICTGFFFGVMLAIVAGLQHNPRALTVVQRNGGGLTLILFSLLGAIALETICEGFHGCTLGKLLLGFVVVQEDGSRCRPGPALIRSLAYFIDGLFFGVVGYFNMQKNPQQQRHGDEWAHTIVCRRAAVAPQNLRGTGHFVMVFLLAAMADAALFMIGMLTKVLA